MEMNDCSGCDGTSCKGQSFEEQINGVWVKKKGFCCTTEEKRYFCDHEVTTELPLLWNPAYDTDHWTRSK